MTELQSIRFATASKLEEGMIETLYFRYQNPRFQNNCKALNRRCMLDHLLPRNVITEKRQFHLLPLKAEKILSNYCFCLDTQGLRASFEAPVQTPWQNYQDIANDILLQLQSVLPKQNGRARDFDVMVIQSQDANARAYSGGHIVISDQLMRDIYNTCALNKYSEVIARGDTNNSIARVNLLNVRPEDMIAAVIGHEMIRICARRNSVTLAIHCLSSVIWLIFSCIWRLATNHFIASKKKEHVHKYDEFETYNIDERLAQYQEVDQKIHRLIVRHQYKKKIFDDEVIAKKIKLSENLLCLIQHLYHCFDQMFKLLISRQFEFEYDKYSMIYSACANYDPRGGILLQKMLSAKDLMPKPLSRLVEWFQGLPTHDRRIDHLVHEIMRHSEKVLINQNHLEDSIFEGNGPFQDHHLKSDGNARAATAPKASAPPGSHRMK